MNNQEDPIERLARRTAEENDRLARRRHNEINDPWKYMSPQQKQKQNTFIWICVGLFIAVMVFALSFH